MERFGVKITRLCPIIVQFFLWKGSVHTNSILECLRVSTFGSLWLRLLGNDFLTNLLACGIGHSRVCTWQACCPRLDKAWSSFFTEHTFFPQVPDRLCSQLEGQFLSSFLKGWAQFFMLLWLETLSTLFLRPPTTYNPVVYATKYALQSERDCIAQRSDVAEPPQELADSLFEEYLHALRLLDPQLIVDLFFGLPQLGWAMPAPTMQCREAPPEYPIEALKTDCGNHNSKLISRCRPSGDDKLDVAAWEKTEEELSSEMILGPFFDLQDVPFPCVRLLRRFGTWEQHGGAKNPTVRLIDDALEGGQNGATGRPTDLDSWATQCRMVQERFPQSALFQFPSDFKKAYKQVPAEPSLACFAVMVQWHPQKRCPAFLVGRTQLFGGKSCPVNFVATPWLPWLAGLLRIVWMTSLLSTGQQQFSRDGLSGMS